MTESWFTRKHRLVAHKVPPLPMVGSDDKSQHLAVNMPINTVFHMVSITGTPVVAYIQPVLTGYIFGYLQNTIIHLEYVPHLHWIRQKIPLDKHAKLCATLFSMRSHRKYQIPTHQSLQNTHKFTRPLRDTPCCSKKPIHT